ncbi:unnamed protein product, partial [Mycena citricolor]
SEGMSESARLRWINRDGGDIRSLHALFFGSASFVCSMGLLYYLRCSTRKRLLPISNLAHSYAGIAVAFAFVTLSLASGLLYISELIEEHTRLAKTIGQRAIYAIIALHVVLYFSDSLPLQHTLFSALCHVVYLRNFSATWPVISLSSLTFIASCVLVIADHFIWFFHFSHLTQAARHVSRQRGPKGFRAGPPTARVPSFSEIATFFAVCVWAAPLFLFLSLSANDNALPVSGTEGTPGLSYPTEIKTKPRVSLFRSLLFFRSRNRNEQGIIAPPSPGIVPQHSPMLAPLASPRFSTLTPPRSPRYKPAELEAELQASNFKLNTPPLRSDGLGQRRRSVLSDDGLFNS